ncbi:mas-related G-protein coupled receptor member G [Dipodomys merriami]|uniref:mas-related G-protein coupled receptor member G n=1 Tax=Dipodomys merriami TaxID=94247 RepID=UPI003855FB27
MINIFNPWTAFNNVIFYITLVLSAGGVVGNGVLIWSLVFHIKKGALNLYLLNLAAADFLFLSCQVGFSCAQLLRGSADSTLYFVITFLWFSVGLWLLACFCLDGWLSSTACHQHRRPRITSPVLCALAWALALPAVLLPADACGMLTAGSRWLTCIRYYSVSIVWLLALVGVGFGATMAFIVWASCCTPTSQRPKFYSLVRSSGLLLLFCRLPLVICWSLRPLLAFLFSFLPPLATLLACVDSSCKPLLYLLAGMQLGRWESLRVVLHRVLSEETQPGLRGLALPMARV